jgi:malonyl-CoA/methylmalonyl-CoA synthetase
MNTFPIYERARQHPDRTALCAGAETFSYRELADRADRVAAALLGEADDLQEKRIGVLVPPGADYVAAQWGIWRAGGTFVPLSLAGSPQEISYAVDDAEISCLVTTPEKARELPANASSRSLCIDDALVTPAGEKLFPAITPDRRAMMVYTSGTTSKPKGVVTTHGCLTAQIESLVEAWRWSDQDRIPLFLPLHHVHGIVNVLGCALWLGALVETFGRFDATEIFPRVAADAYTVFMAVPTIYVKMIEALEKMEEPARAGVVGGFARLRLMVSGSAALPAGVHRRWEEITGQKLLERYGMTEIGMALSNPYEGERRPGSVGLPLPGVQVRLKNDEGRVVTAEDEPGEIQVRGATVFLEYWNRPGITAESFDAGWFRTGDIAVRERGYYRIMGRSSVDIIKSGGYKLSALEIETVLLDHPDIAECAVLGVEDPTWGESVAAVVVLRRDTPLSEESLRDWCKDRMSPYKVPRLYKFVDTLPRNAMGKVTKPDVKKLFA